MAIILYDEIKRNLEHIRDFFKAAVVPFRRSDENGGGPGVRLRKGAQKKRNQ